MRCRETSCARSVQIRARRNEAQQQRSARSVVLQRECVDLLRQSPGALTRARKENEQNIAVGEPRFAKGKVAVVDENEVIVGRLVLVVLG